jgi:flagellin
MSFRINNNIDAMRSYHDVSRVTGEMNKSMGRLSKGLRIAEAGDDPSGLISSELFRSRISSMESAIRNNQEALNYSKSAENGLGEMNKLLTEARSLAIASGNSATLSAAQLAANQDQFNGIIGAINRVSSTTTYGNRRLLDGSSGVSTQVSNSAKVSGWSFGGQANATTITLNGLASINQTVLATRALYTSTAGGGLATGARNTGAVAINGVSFNFAIGQTGASMAAEFNKASGQTGVTAVFNTTTNNLEFAQTQTGTNRTITFTDTSGVISAAANTQAGTAGTNAVAQVIVGGQTSLYTGGLQGADGLTLRDINGNTLNITDGGNATGTSLLGRVTAGESRFQVGIDAGNTANLGLRNMGAAQLGTGVVTGVANLSAVDLTTGVGATNALTVIDKAIEEVSVMRGRIGNFQRNTLESNNRNLTTMKENLSNSESSIRDLDVADEMTKFTKWQVMQQAGMSMLGQANQSGQSVLSLLRG